MTASTLLNPAVEFQSGTVAWPATGTREPQNHWAWTGWMPEND
ncbi:hypothetical protein ACT3UQ_00405 [Glutamicibacter sp. AOP12-B1-11]|nr:MULTISPECIES: hypothetical protein [unclassified Arthrobacter]